jgi:hypothetical protein
VAARHDACAHAINRIVESLDIRLRANLHNGEVGMAGE